MVSVSQPASAQVTPLRARIYARDSFDKSGKRASPDRQIEQARDLIRARGWVEAGDPFVDSSTPASKQRTTTRAQYIAFVDAMARGEFDVPVAHHDDRLWRTISEREAFMWMASDAGISLVATCYGDFEVGHADDDFRGELNVMLAKREAATVARRMRASHETRAARGEWPGGKAPFGYRLDPERRSLAIEPTEAAAVAEMVRRVLAGEAVLAIIRDMVAAGHFEANRGPGLARTLTGLVLSPTLAGLRVRDGQKVPGNWPAIITVADHERLVAMAAARRRGPRHSTASANVLAGLLVCGRCGTKLRASVVAGKGRYACPVKGMGGCGGTSVPIVGADARAVELVAAELDSEAFAGKVREAIAAAPDTELADVAAQLAADRAQLGVLADAFADGDMTRDAYRRAVARVDARVADAEAMLARAAASVGPVMGLVGRGDEVREMFERSDGGGYTFAERRAILSAVADRFVVAPSVKGQRSGPRFDASRITMVPRFMH